MASRSTGATLGPDLAYATALRFGELAWRSPDRTRAPSGRPCPTDLPRRFSGSAASSRYSSVIEPFLTVSLENLKNPISGFGVVLGLFLGFTLFLYPKKLPHGVRQPYSTEYSRVQPCTAVYSCLCTHSCTLFR